MPGLAPGRASQASVVAPAQGALELVHAGVASLLRAQMWIARQTPNGRARSSRPSVAAHRREERVVASRDDDVAVSRPRRLPKGVIEGMSRADWPRHLARGLKARDCVLENRDLAVEHRDVDLLPLARLRPLVEGGVDPDRGEEPGSVMSPIDAAHARRFGPPGVPVRLMMPPMPWTTMS